MRGKGRGKKGGAHQVKVKQIRKTARAMALIKNVFGGIPNCLDADCIRAINSAWRPGQHNRNDGTNRLCRTGGYSNYNKNIVSLLKV